MQELSRLAEFRPVADAVMKSIQRHTSYLESSAVVFALFNDELAVQQRQNIAAALAATPRPSTIAMGKPGPAEICNVSELASFVGPRSWLLFILLDELNNEWLQKPVEEWNSDPGYKTVHKYVNSLAVVNDGAERGVKLAQDLIDRTEDEDQLQALAQVVAWHRSSYGHTKKDYLGM